MGVTSSETQAFSVLRLVALRRSATDLQRAVAFYCNGLGFEVAGNESTPGEIVIVLGEQRIVLVECNSGTAPLVLGPDVRFQHAAIVASDMRTAFARLQKQAPVAISRGCPQLLPAASGGACAFKFRDPDGHPLELIEFPRGHGAAHWSAVPRRDAGPTLGIDHAAISVSNVDRSIAFYERLGFRLGSRQTNRGAEQARLDGLAVADVEVVALFPSQAGSPHLELLGYRTPKPTCSDGTEPATADRLIWQARAMYRSASPVVDRQYVAVTDPDGHLHGIDI